MDLPDLLEQQKARVLALRQELALSSSHATVSTAIAAELSAKMIEAISETVRDGTLLKSFVEAVLSAGKRGHTDEDTAMTMALGALMRRQALDVRGFLNDQVTAHELMRVRLQGALEEAELLVMGISKLVDPPVEEVAAEARA